MFWQTSFDQKSGAHVHRLPRGAGHALLLPLVSDMFKTLRVSAYLYDGRQRWWPLHAERSPVAFELEHGKNRERIAYNERSITEVRRKLGSMRGEYAGFFDVFAPVVIGGKLAAILVVGPFAVESPSGREISKRWHDLTQRQGNLGDPEFLAYVSSTLQMLVLDRSSAQALEKLTGVAASLMAAEGNADQLLNQAELLRVKLGPSRLPERHWDAAKTMLDERTQWTWSSQESAFYLEQLGLSRMPDHVLVGLTLSPKQKLDPVEEAVRRDALQREAAHAAARIGNVVAGRVGDHGVVFLAAGSGSAARRKHLLSDLMERMHGITRKRFGLSLHFGAGAAGRSLTLSRSYEIALGAAERAVTEGVRFATVKSDLPTPKHSLRELRQELSRGVEEAPESITARFERYLALVELECGYHFGAARSHLEAGLETMALPLIRKGALDPKSFSRLCEALDRRAAEATILGDLFGAYRQAAADISQAILAPVAAGRDRSLRAALDFIHEHFTESLDFERVARRAGFAPNYFSALFKQREGTTFERYVLGLRLERAKQLLTNTELEVARVADLCGFGTPQYFCRAFKQAAKETPNGYRAKRVLP